MGEGVGILCKNCKAREEFLVGVGFMYSSLESVLSDVKGKTRQTIVGILSDQQIHSEEYEHALYSCPSCNTLHSRFYVKVEYGDGEIFETKFRCGRCRKALVRADQSIEHYNCKACGSKALEQEYEIMWD